MKKQNILFIAICAAGLFLSRGLLADGEKTDSTAEKKGFVFTVVTDAEATAVKNQFRTGTCWTFATNSFLESELIRMGKEAQDLSEMYVVRKTYPKKARNYVRLHGNTTIGSGSLSQDVLRVIREYGIVPESVYHGRFAGQSLHNHAEMDAVLEAMLNVIVQNKGKKLSPAWPQAIEGVLDAYLGKAPEKFAYAGKSWTPRQFADHLGIKPDNYIEFTSFSHHPWYSDIIVELPDNWAGNRSINLPLDELMQLLDNALEHGFTAGWDGDVSEKSFSNKKGVAILPQLDWDLRSTAQKDSILEQPEPELAVTQELRQELFDSYQTTDDHLMHVTGISKDQNGTRYYITKNSWGTIDAGQKGFVHMSESYMRAKTISFMVHKDAVPAALRKKIKM